jgi:hypothetical protein
LDTVSPNQVCQVFNGLDSMEMAPPFGELYLDIPITEDLHSNGLSGLDMEFGPPIGVQVLDVPIPGDQVFGRPDEHSDGLRGSEIELGPPMGDQYLDIPIMEDLYSYLRECLLLGTCKFGGLRFAEGFFRAG